MEVEAMEEGEINDEAGKEVVMEDMDYAELMNKFAKPKKRVGGETGPMDKLSCMNYISYFIYHRPILSTTNHQALQLTDVTRN
jgi:hypothetical protein